MLVWAYALVFARMNNLDVIVGRWSQYRWGAILRREKKNRRYKGYFKETSLLRLVLFRLRLVFYKKYFDPEVAQLGESKPNVFYVFKKPFPRRELFKELVPYEGFIRDNLYNMLTPELKDNAKNLTPPEIAVHVRRGDFRLGNPITPNAFFISVINGIREAVGSELSVIVFTDAAEDEISDILSLENVSLSENKEDILDLLQMSKAKFLVLSRSSSFSYWAAFLSEAFVIMSDEDWQLRIKKPNHNYVEYHTKTEINRSELNAQIKQFVS